MSKTMPKANNSSLKAIPSFGMTEERLEDDNGSHNSELAELRTEMAAIGL